MVVSEISLFFGSEHLEPVLRGESNYFRDIINR